MSKTRRILVKTSALAAGAALVAGCGQSGPLYLPKEPAAAHRATLPETLHPATPDAPATPTPLSPATPPPAP